MDDDDESEEDEAIEIFFNSELSNFERNKDKFDLGESVYIIDDNVFDLYNAIIIKVNKKDNKYDSHYTDLCDEDESNVPISRILSKTEINNTLFEIHEVLRNQNQSKKERNAKLRKLKKQLEKNKIQQLRNQQLQLLRQQNQQIQLLQQRNQQQQLHQLLQQ